MEYSFVQYIDQIHKGKQNNNNNNKQLRPQHEINLNKTKRISRVPNYNTTYLFEI